MENQNINEEDIFLILSKGQDWQIIKLIREGITKNALLRLGNAIGFTMKELASILDLSVRVLQRYSDDTKLSKVASEKAIALANLYQHGEDVFGKMEIFNRWMKTPHFMFKQRCPMDVLDTYCGIQMVHAELGRIEHGIFA